MNEVKDEFLQCLYKFIGTFIGIAWIAVTVLVPIGICALVIKLILMMFGG